MVARGLRLTVVAVVCVVAGGLLFASGSAFAAVTYPFDGQFAGGAYGVAVNDFNGGIYMVEEQADVVDVLGANGVQVQASIDGSTTPAGSFGSGNERLEVAANDGTGDVYVLDTAHNVIDEFDSTGGYLCQITGSPTPSSSECNGPAGSETPDHGFANLRGIAVNQVNGDVYVVDTQHGVVDAFSATGAYQSQIAPSVLPESFPAGLNYGSLAVDGSNGRVYIDDWFRSSIYEFNAGGEYVATLTGSNTPAGSIGTGESSIAINDSTGTIYVTDQEHGVTDAFDASWAYLTQFSHSYRIPTSTAVDQATGRIYISDMGSAPAPSFVDIFGPGVTVPDVHTGAATEVEPTSATLNGTVDPDGLQMTDCHFDYGNDTSYGQTAPCVPGAGSIPADSNEHAVSAHPTGLQPGVAYHFRLVASNANSAEGPSVGTDETLSTPPPPTMENAAATNIERISADISANVDPKGFATTYHFEWGETIGYGNRVPALSREDREIGAEVAATIVTTHLTGLKEDKIYHWRVLATNKNGTTSSPDHTFVYDTVGGGLPDNRAYEMVTPPQKNAAAIPLVLFGALPTISEDGSRFMGTSIQCFAGAQSCIASRQNEGEPYLFTRTVRGWMTTALAPAATPGGNTAWLDNADAGTALFSLPTPPGNEDDWFAEGIDGKLVDVGATTPPSGGERGNGDFGGALIVATPDLSHIIWESKPVWSFDQSTKRSVYEYVGNGNASPALVGVNGGPESVSLVSQCSTALGSEDAVSLDGRVVFFTALGHDAGETNCPKTLTAPPTSQLYARIDQAETVDISARSPMNCSGASGCSASPPGDAHFEDASADGRRVFFTDTQQLTSDASEDSLESDSASGGCERTTGVNGCNLYEYDLSGKQGENLTAISAGDSSGGGPRVQCVMGVSSDGSHIYFVAKGVLSGTANERGQVPQSGGENMYVFERDTTYPQGHIAFIAVLPKTDVFNTVAHGGENETSVTPDGRFIVFTSRGELTPDETGASQLQVFRYDAQTTQLSRISVGNDGFNDNGNLPPDLACGLTCPEDAGLARNTSIERRDQTMSHDGAYVFFESAVGLTPQALNDFQIATDEGHPVYAENIYEWHAGHVYLISDGKDTTTAGELERSSVKLIGADATGANVFFSTADSLVPEDTDTQLDYYDARICTANDPCIAPSAPASPPCLGEACHGTPVATPLSPNVPTATFSGQGNVHAAEAKAVQIVKKAAKCSKGKKRIRGKCVKVKSKRRNAGNGRKATAGSAGQSAFNSNDRLGANWGGK